MSHVEQMHDYSNEILRTMPEYPSHKDITPEMEDALKIARAQAPEEDWDTLVRRGDALKWMKNYLDADHYTLLKRQDREVEKKQYAWIKEYTQKLETYYTRNNFVNMNN